MTAVDVFHAGQGPFPKWRTATSAPESRLSVSRLISGDFQKDYETMVSDQFAGRDGWITAKSVSESALQKTENNGVLYGKNGAFFGKFTSYNETQLERNLYFLENFANDGHPLTFAIVPSAYEYAEDQLPLGAGQVDQRPVIAGVKETLSDNENITWFDADAVLAAQQSEDLFYRTDHHWKGGNRLPRLRRPLRADGADAGFRRRAGAARGGGLLRAATTPSAKRRAPSPTPFPSMTSPLKSTPKSSM